MKHQSLSWHRNNHPLPQITCYYGIIHDNQTFDFNHVPVGLYPLRPWCLKWHALSLTDTTSWVLVDPINCTKKKIPGRVSNSDITAWTLFWLFEIPSTFEEGSRHVKFHLTSIRDKSNVASSWAQPAEGSHPIYTISLSFELSSLILPSYTTSRNLSRRSRATESLTVPGSELQIKGGKITKKARATSNKANGFFRDFDACFTGR